MEPYYQDDHVTLYHGDSLEIMPTLNTGAIHAVVTDPPYVIGAVSAGNMASKAGSWGDMMNSSTWFTVWYQQVDRLLKKTGALWTFCNWRSLPVVMRAAINAQLPITSLMVWDKEVIGTGHKQGLRHSYELCALMAKPEFTIPDRSLRDVWHHKTGTHKPHGHPAEKPVALIERILHACNFPKGSLILDPFAGSGTTAVAARNLGLNCILIETDESYCELASKRLAQDILPLKTTP